MLKVVGASWFQTRMSKLILVAVVLLGVIILILGEIEVKAEDGNYAATVTWVESTGFNIEFWGQGNDPQEIPQGVARAYYRPDLNFDGWAKLEIQTHSGSPDWIQAFAAGLLEGSLTWQMIYWHWINTVQNVCQNRQHLCEEIHSVLEENERWTREKAAENKATSPFWYQVHLFYLQLDGLEVGWRQGVERSRLELDIPHLDFIWMNAVTDIIDLERRHSSTLEPSLGLFTAANFSSILVKHLHDTQEIFMAHNTGGMYQSMLRLLKRYELNYHEAPDEVSDIVPGQVIEFSSYPGSIHSQDDFYVISGMSPQGKNHQLKIASIPINNYNRALWRKSKPQQQVLSGPRVMTANRLAQHARQWVHHLAESNSGTGNRQWVVLDTGKVGKPPRESNRGLRRRRGSQKSRHQKHHLHGLLCVVEQLPGLTRASDVSHQLIAEGFWASLRGVPYHQDICDASHCADMKQTLEQSSLARSFKEDQKRATDVATIMYLMRNYYYNDTLLSEDEQSMIAPRGDIQLDPKLPLGVIDTKVSIWAPNTSVQVYAIAGPPFSMNANTSAESNDESNDVPQDDVDNHKYPVFPYKWSSSSFVNLSHLGQPDVWNFNIFVSEWSWHQHGNYTVAPEKPD
ncbi:putative phospholipase B-like lamina ancestor isoform X1 [Schistocerca americana]|uniref:putative phospholipase B-like lamina ancestor isoform X1 n=2 Tax=Schistocerca americana TaxID=7009 RepID=UPI001F4FDF34|nr:putative phospholipase B-like lamina ancestor isoform X1 [Schistocerca americana]